MCSIPGNKTRPLVILVEYKERYEKVETGTLSGLDRHQTELWETKMHISQEIFFFPLQTVQYMDCIIYNRRKGIERDPR
jgi:hypothetical protein